jgi:diacylglycerol O-acyltransferase / wax synthase
MTDRRLSALDASFLALETPTAHMHVGWVASFAPPAGRRSPSFSELRDHIELRLGRAPRYRQRLASVPLGLNLPEWADDRAFSVDRHVYRAAGPLDELVDEVLSIPLRRDRPLWEMWICENTEDQGFAIVGKTHHCMVDGLAAIELVTLLLDSTPEPVASEPDRWRAAPAPRGERLLVRGVRDLVTDQLGLLNWPLRAATSPARAARQTAAGAMRTTRAVSHLLRAAPASVINRQLSPLRRLARTQRPLGDLRIIKRAYDTTVNDVILAAVAGGIRSYLMRRGEDPVALKVMVPVSVRNAGDGLGNHISFVFTELPCDEPYPLGRLYRVNAAMTRHKRDGEPQGTDLVFKAAARTPATLQQALSKLIASPRTFNLVVSNLIGPSEPMYMLGCPLQGAYPVVPLAERHAVSVGMISVDDQACFGVYADSEALPDIDWLAQDIDDAITELLAAARRFKKPPGSPRRRITGAPSARPAPDRQPPGAAAGETIEIETVRQPAK